ncbi:putative ribonuclease H-like domain-containing protein [Tanacetum coccineum]
MRNHERYRISIHASSRIRPGRKNEVLFSEEVAVLKREVGIKQYKINMLKTEFEKVKKEKDGIKFKIKKFDKASKDLDQLLEKPEFKGYGPENSKKESNVVCKKESDNSKENSNKSLVKEQESQVKSNFVEGSGSNTSKNVSKVEPKKVMKNNDAPIIEDWVSDDEEQDESMTKPEKKIVIPTVAKIEKPVKKSVWYAKMYRSQRPRGNQRNWNDQKSNQLGRVLQLSISLGYFEKSAICIKKAREDQFRNQDNTRKQGNKEDTSKANVWLLMVVLKQYDDMLAKLHQTKFEAITYKRGLDTVEAQLVTYRKNEVLFSKEVVVLKREVGIKQYEIILLINRIDTDKSKKGLGYSAVPPPHPLIYNRPNKLDLSYSGLDEFKEPEFKGYGPENSKKESNVVCEKESDNSKENSDKRKNNDAPIIEDWVSDDEEQDESMTKPEKKTVIPTAAKIEKPVKKSVRYAEMYRSQRPRGNQRNWNGQKSNQLGSEFVMYNKACFNCGSFKHVQKNCTYHQKKKVVSGNNYNRVDNYYYAKTSHHRTHKNVTPRAVLLRTGLKPLNPAKSVYTAHPKPTVHCARPKTHFFKSAQSTIQRPFYKKPALTNRNFNHKVNIVRPIIVNAARSYRTPVNIVRPRVVNTARQNRTLVNAARANGFNDVKPSACWGKPQHDDKGFVDSGCSRNMTGNITYLFDFKQFDGGYVAFGGVILKTDLLNQLVKVNAVKKKMFWSLYIWL